MLGEKLDEVFVTERGVVGDRAYALREVATRQIASAKKFRSCSSSVPATIPRRRLDARSRNDRAANGRKIHAETRTRRS